MDGVTTTTRTRRYIAAPWEVQAWLAGTKSRFCVPIRPQPPKGYRSMVSDMDRGGAWWFSDMPPQEGIFPLSEFKKWSHVYPKCPFRVGDRVAVCEAWCDSIPGEDYVFYKDDPGSEELDGTRWRSAATMPTKYARITQIVWAVSPMLVREMSEEQAAAEGAQMPAVIYPAHSHQAAFRARWTARYGKRYPWDSSWVWDVSVESEVRP